MQTQPESQSSSTQRVYYLPRGRRFFTLTLLIVCLILLLTGAPKILLLQDGRLVGAYFILLVLVLACIPIAYLRMRKVRLVTSPQGIAYYGPSYSIYSPWHNVMGRTVMISANSTVMGLRLAHPAASMNLTQGFQQDRPALEMGRWMRLLNGDDFNAPRAIPIGDFLAHNRDVEEDIRQYAPQVFESTPADQAQNEQKQS